MVVFRSKILFIMAIFDYVIFDQVTFFERTNDI